MNILACKKEISGGELSEWGGGEGDEEKGRNAEMTSRSV